MTKRRPEGHEGLIVATEAKDIPTDRVPDRELNLVRRLRAGDSGAYEELCDRFGAALHGFAAQRLAGDQESAEEVMMQTLTDAVRNVGRYDPRRASLSTWVYGIARRKIQGERRRLLRRKSVPASARSSMETLGEVGSRENVAEEVAAQLDAQRRVAELSRVLSDAEMEVLLLHFADGFSVKEIGWIVGRSAKAADSLLHRAVRKAREELVKSDD